MGAIVDKKFLTANILSFSKDDKVREGGVKRLSTKSG